MKITFRIPAIVLTVALANVAGAQDSSRPTDPVLERARAMANAGRDSDGRRLIDSVLQAHTPRDPIYAEALYTRAVIAPTAAEAERDYRRLLIETPLSPRTEDALLQLANLLQARGDRRGASEYLQRFLLTHANSPARPRVAVSLVRLLFEQGPSQEARACEALRQGRDIVPPGNLELRNQLEFYVPRCAMYGQASRPTPVTAPVTTRETTRETAPVTTPVTTQVTTPVTAPVTTPASPGAPAAGGSVFYSVQVAAYGSEEAAQRVAKLLVERGLQARVDGTTAPFRVRIGRYATRAEATKAMQLLKSQGHPGFVAQVGGR